MGMYISKYWKKNAPLVWDRSVTGRKTPWLTPRSWWARRREYVRARRAAFAAADLSPRRVPKWIDRRLARSAQKKNLHYAKYPGYVFGNRHRPQPMPGVGTPLKRNHIVRFVRRSLTPGWLAAYALFNLAQNAQEEPNPTGAGPNAIGNRDLDFNLNNRVLGTTDEPLVGRDGEPIEGFEDRTMQEFRTLLEEGDEAALGHYGATSAAQALRYFVTDNLHRLLEADGTDVNGQIDELRAGQYRDLPRFADMYMESGDIAIFTDTRLIEDQLWALGHGKVFSAGLTRVATADIEQIDQEDARLGPELLPDAPTVEDYWETSPEEADLTNIATPYKLGHRNGQWVLEDSTRVAGNKYGSDFGSTTPVPQTGVELFGETVVGYVVVAQTAAVDIEGTDREVWLPDPRGGVVPITTQDGQPLLDGNGEFNPTAEFRGDLLSPGFSFIDMQDQGMNDGRMPLFEEHADFVATDPGTMAFDTWLRRSLERNPHWSKDNPARVAPGHIPGNGVTFAAYMVPLEPPSGPGSYTHRFGGTYVHRGPQRGKYDNVGADRDPATQSEVWVARRGSAVRVDDLALGRDDVEVPFGLPDETPSVDAGTEARTYFDPGQRGNSWTGKAAEVTQDQSISRSTLT